MKIRVKIKKKDVLLGEESKSPWSLDGKCHDLCMFEPQKSKGSAKRIKNKTTTPTEPTEPTTTVSAPEKKKKIKENKMLNPEEIEQLNRENLQKLIRQVSPQMRAAMLDLYEMHQESGELESMMQDRNFIRDFVDAADSRVAKSY